MIGGCLIAVADLWWRFQYIYCFILLVGWQEGYLAWKKLSSIVWGTGITGLMRGMAILPQGNQELLVVRDKVGRPPGELGVSKSMECDIFPSVLLHCWLGDRKGIRPVKNWMLLCWWWWFDWSFARLIAAVVTTTSIILCFNKHWLTQVHLENGH